VSTARRELAVLLIVAMVFSALGGVVLHHHGYGPSSRAVDLSQASGGGQPGGGVDICAICSPLMHTLLLVATPMGVVLPAGPSLVPPHDGLAPRGLRLANNPPRAPPTV